MTKHLCRACDRPVVSPGAYFEKDWYEHDYCRPCLDQPAPPPDVRCPGCRQDFAFAGLSLRQPGYYRCPREGCGWEGKLVTGKAPESPRIGDLLRPGALIPVDGDLAPTRQPEPCCGNPRDHVPNGINCWRPL